MSRAFRGIAACTSHHFPSSVLSYLNSPQGRADYLHAIADLLGRPAHGIVPRGPGVVGLDIGTGPLCVYPLIGHAEYGWSFLATDVDAKSMECAEKLLKSNEGVPIRLRLQPDRQSVLRNVLTPRPGSASATDASDQRDPEVFAFTMCNPPFYSSEAEAASAAARKWRGLARVSKGDGRGAATSTERRGGLRSFGGSASEPPLSPARMASSTVSSPRVPSVRGSSGSTHSVAFLAAESGIVPPSSWRTNASAPASSLAARSDESCSAPSVAHSDDA